MKLLWHIVKKDLRYFWLGVGLIWILAGTRMWIAFAMARVEPSNGWHLDELDWAQMALDWLISALEVGLVVLLVKEDGAARSAWWWTRPLRGRVVAAAKLAEIVMLFWIPLILAEVPWWRATGFDASLLVRAIESELAWQMIVTLLPAALAVTVPTWRSFLVTLGVVIGVVGWCGIMLGGILPNGAEWAVREIDSSELVVWLVLMVGIGAGVSALLKYTTRRTLLSVSVGLLVVELLIGGGFVCAVLLHLGRLPPDTGALIPATQKIEITRVSADVPAPRRGETGGARLDLRLTGLTTALRVRPQRLEEKWQWDDGMKFQPARMFWSTEYLMPDKDLKEPSIRVALGFDEPKPAAFEWVSRTPIRPTLIRKWQQKTPTWRGDQFFETSRPVVDWEIPLKVGSTLQDKGWHFRVAEINCVAERAEVNFALAVRRADLPQRSWQDRDFRQGSFYLDVTYAIVHRARHEFMILSGFPGQNDGLEMDGVRMQWWRDAVTLADGRPELAREWLAGAALVKLHFELVQQYHAAMPERRLTIDRSEKADPGKWSNAWWW